MNQSMRKLSLAAALLAGTFLPAAALADGAITRIATMPLEAELTGLHLTPQGDLFPNAQHPSDKNAGPFDRATVGGLKDMVPAGLGVITGADGKGDIRLDEDKCGAVYEMKLDSNFSVARMVPAIVGGPYDKAAKPNACSVDAIANPDNVQVPRDGRVLVGEDTGKHENDMLWLWTPGNRPAI